MEMNILERDDGITHVALSGRLDATSAENGSFEFPTVKQVFRTGKFRGAEMNPSSPEKALANMAENGTASILDISRISAQPDYHCAAPLSTSEVEHYFGTDKPTVEMVQACDELWETMERGQARYVIVYEGESPVKLMFIGYSFD